jgi:hypothetical protein
MPFSYERAPPEYDGSELSDADECPSSRNHPKPVRPRSSHFLNPYYSSPSNSNTLQDPLLQHRNPSPFNSRSFVSTSSSSTYGSDTDEISAPLLRLRSSGQHWIGSQYWWAPVGRHSRRRKRRLVSARRCMACLYSITRSPCFPSQPTTMVSSVSFLPISCDPSLTFSFFFLFK